MIAAFPLTEAEKRKKMQAPQKQARQPLVRVPNSPSPWWKLRAENLTTVQKGHIAEAAVLFRLTVLGISVHGSPFDGDSLDWIVKTPRGKLKTLQVRWARRTSGSPAFSLKKSAGRGKFKRYEEGDFDFLIGYYLRNDTAYVWSSKDLTHLRSLVSATPDAAEAWHKIIKA